MRRQASKRAALGAALFLLSFASFAHAEVVQEGNLRVSFTGGLAPHKLPRGAPAPVRVDLAGEIKTTDGLAPPQLRTISLAINRHGKLNYKGLPVCHFHQIQPASTNEAIEACRDSVIGKGTFQAHVVLPEQSPFPSQGKVVAFNGTFNGAHVIYAHVYGTVPLPQSQVLVFRLGRASGTYRTTLSAELPQVAAEWGYVSGLSLSLQRSFTYKGRARSFLSASCPAAKGFPGASYDFARASFGFEDGRVLGAVMRRSCGVQRTSK